MHKSVDVVNDFFRTNQVTPTEAFMAVIAYFALNGETISKAREQVTYHPKRRQTEITNTSVPTVVRARGAIGSGRNYKKLR